MVAYFALQVPEVIITEGKGGCTATGNRAPVACGSEKREIGRQSPFENPVQARLGEGWGVELVFFFLRESVDLV